MAIKFRNIMAIKFHLFESKHTMARGHNIKISKHGDIFFQSVGMSLLVARILSFKFLDKFV